MREFTTAARAEAFRRKFGGALIERDGAYFVELSPTHGKPPREEASPEAAEKRRRGGQKGGAERARRLTPEQRSAIAKKGGLARWRGKAGRRRKIVSLRVNPEEHDRLRSALERRPDVVSYRDLFLRAVEALDLVEKVAEGAGP